MIETPFGLPEKAANIFERYSQLLGDRLQPEDSHLLAQLAIAEMQAVEAAQVLAEDGAIHEDKTHGKQSRRSAQFSVWKQSVELAQKLSVELGITPKQRRLSDRTESNTNLHDLLYQ